MIYFGMFLAVSAVVFCEADLVKFPPRIDVFFPIDLNHNTAYLNHLALTNFKFLDFLTEYLKQRACNILSS